MDDNRDVELRFPPVAEHVRTARLVAVAVARRVGLDDIRLDEVRLAVGEACARAVRRCRRSGTPGPVILVLSDSLTETSPGLRVEVWDDGRPVPEGESEIQMRDGGKLTPEPQAENAEVGREQVARGADPRAGDGVEVGREQGARGREGRAENVEVGRGDEGGVGEGAHVVPDEDEDELDEGEVLALLAGLADRVDVMDGTAGPGGRVRMIWTQRPARRTSRRVRG